MLQNAGVLDLIQKEMLFIFYRFSKCRLITSSSFTVRCALQSTRPTNSF